MEIHRKENYYMNGKPYVSIIIPAYNVEGYISKGIESCIKQSFENIEIVIVDDGSTDDTWNLIEKYKRIDARIVAIHQNNKGVSAARNCALENATGKMALFLDSDDWLEIEAVSELKKISENNPNYLVCTDCYFVVDHEGIIERKNQTEGNECAKLIQEDALMSIGGNNGYKLHSSCYKLFDLDLIKSNHLHFKEKISNGEDGLFTFEYLKKIKGLVYEPIALWNILCRPGSATNTSYNSKWLTAIDAIEKMLSYPDNKEAVTCNLKAFLADRALCLLIDCCKDNKTLDDDRTILKSKMKENIYYYFKRNFSIKRCIQYIVLEYFPLSFIKIIFR